MSYSQETLSLEKLKQINQAVAKGNSALEQLPIKNQKIKSLKEIISAQEEIINNDKSIIESKDQQIRLIVVERDSYRNSAQTLNQQNKSLYADLEKEMRRKKNWRKFSVGSTTVAIGLAGTLFFLLK